MANGQPIIDDASRIAGQAIPGSTGTPSDGAGQLLAAANGGHLVFDPQTGQSLLKTLNDVIDELAALMNFTLRFKSFDKLGLTAGGLAIGKLNGQVVGSGPKAFVPAHQQFLQAIITAADAVKIAMDNYARAEQRIGRSFRSGH
jgi:hypothetical protein